MKEACQRFQEYLKTLRSYFQLHLRLSQGISLNLQVEDKKWIDQAQSLNLYIGNADGKKLDITYRMAWYSGLKTTYYLRSIAATSTEKSTVQQGKLNAVSSEVSQPAAQELGAPAPVPTACSLDDPDCEACQ